MFVNKIQASAVNSTRHGGGLRTRAHKGASLDRYMESAKCLFIDTSERARASGLHINENSRAETTWFENRREQRERSRTRCCCCRNGARRAVVRTWHATLHRAMFVDIAAIHLQPCGFHSVVRSLVYQQFHWICLSKVNCVHRARAHAELIYLGPGVCYWDIKMESGSYNLKGFC